jgi:hypothetical protein
MRPVRVVVLDELAEYHGEVTRSGDQQVVEAFAAQSADEAFGDRIRPRCPHRCADDGDVGAGEDRVEGGIESRGLRDWTSTPISMVLGIPTVGDRVLALVKTFLKAGVMTESASPFGAAPGFAGWAAPERTRPRPGTRGSRQEGPRWTPHC